MEIRPQPGPQSSLLSSAADIAIFGGAAGGGIVCAVASAAARIKKDIRAPVGASPPRS